MFNHLFKLIWNKKKQNFLLISEILISFMVVFAIFTLLVFYYQNFQKPMGMAYQDVWIVNFNNGQIKTKNADSLTLYYETIKKTIKEMPKVRDVSYCSNNIPLTQNTSSGSVNYHKKNTSNVNWYQVQESYKDVLSMHVKEGRWFDTQDAVSKNSNVVINEKLAEDVFGKEDAVGKLLGDYTDKNRMKVIGIVQDVKAKGDYLNAGYALYARIDTGNLRNIGKMLIRVTPDANAAFESRLYKTLANYITGSDVEIEHLTTKRTQTNEFTLIPIIILLIVACFLIINVALGIFGVLWYNINKRRGEIGLRRAIGATGRAVSMQLVIESVILATMSLIIGSFFAVQLPLMNVFGLTASVYLSALLISIVFIYLLVIACSLYPGRQAAAIYPAVALHEE